MERVTCPTPRVQWPSQECDVSLTPEAILYRKRTWNPVITSVVRVTMVLVQGHMGARLVE